MSGKVILEKKISNSIVKSAVFDIIDGGTFIKGSTGSIEQ